MKKWLLLLFLVSFSWEDYENLSEDLAGYRIYIYRVTCTEPTLETEIEIPNPLERHCIYSGTGARRGLRRAHITAVGIDGGESAPSNVVEFKFK